MSSFCLMKRACSEARFGARSLDCLNIDRRQTGTDNAGPAILG